MIQTTLTKVEDDAPISPPEEERLDELEYCDVELSEQEHFEIDAIQRASSRLHCFHCNRQEGFYISSKHRWYHDYLVGFTFGLIYVFGPYRCRCCGHSRLFNRNWLHPRLWLKK